MSDADPKRSLARFREAGAFLRSRRARLSPAEAGLPQGIRRRTPGLRRDEVAMLANIGTTWYTWLEQGRDVHPSAQTLAAIARVLRLDPVETRYLFVLHDLPAPPERGTEEVGESVRRMLASLTAQPALVIGRRWDILAWNAAAETVFGSYATLTADERNSLYLLFANPDRRRLLVDWEEVARSSLAMFRADSARHAGDPDFERLIDTLLATSPEFARWWPEKEVERPWAGRKRIDHPSVGRLCFEYSSFSVDQMPDMRLMVFTPLEVDGTIGKLGRLLAASSPGGGHVPQRDGPPVGDPPRPGR